MYIHKVCLFIIFFIILVLLTKCSVGRIINDGRLRGWMIGLGGIISFSWRYFLLFIGISGIDLVDFPWIVSIAISIALDDVFIAEDDEVENNAEDNED